MLSRDIEGRIFPIFKPSNAHKSKIDTGQKSGDGFRHLNVIIAKNNLAYPLVRDTHSF